MSSLPSSITRKKSTHISDAVRLQGSRLIRELFRWHVALRPLGRDTSIDYRMGDMNMLFVELLRQALRQGAQTMLPSGKRRSSCVPSDGSRRTGEDKCALLPVLVKSRTIR